MDPKKLINIESAEKGLCIKCEHGVIVPRRDGIINFAKCKAENLHPFLISIYTKTNTKATSQNQEK